MLQPTTFDTPKDFFEIAKARALSAWRWSVKVLDRHTDLISDLGILAITTCLLADKIFNSMPAFLPKVALAVFNFGGIIWLNIQVKDLWKSGEDLYRVIQYREWSALFETAAKVFVKATGVLLTCAGFSAAVLSLFGAPQVAGVIYIILKPIGLGNLIVNIGSDVRDYFVNESLLKSLEKMEKGRDASSKILAFTSHFSSLVQQEEDTKKVASKEFALANRMVRQLDIHTIGTFKDALKTAVSVDKVRETEFRRYFALKDALMHKQAGTRANLSLTAMGYISMGICRAFPNSLQEMVVRWTMSVLYTDELVKRKLFQYQLSCDLKT